MHSEDEKVARLADTVLNKVSNLPRADEGQTASGIKIKNNSGTINFGTQVNIGTLSLGGNGGSNGYERQLHQWSMAELKNALAYYRAQWWSGFRGYWLNIPCILMLMLLFGVAGSLLAGILPIRDPQSIWLILAPNLLLILGLSFWLAHIRRIEGRVMAESRGAIDVIRTELRKRR